MLETEGLRPPTLVDSQAPIFETEQRDLDGLEPELYLGHFWGNSFVGSMGLKSNSTVYMLA